MARRRRRGKISALCVLVTLTLVAGLLSLAVVLPIVGVAGVAANDAARSFAGLQVAGLGTLPARSKILDSRGHLIAYYYPRNIYRVPVPYSRIAPVMRHAIVAIEDSRFYQHGAIDPRGTIRALATTLSGAGTQGGSDLAQQYVKNACILTATTRAQSQACTAETVARKLRELRVAANVMHRMTRQQLLAAYLNTAYFENQAYGIQVASRFYFSRPAARLTLTQAALLAGLVQNPAAYDPLAHRQAALGRRDVVLARMAQLGYITRAAAASASARPLGLHVSRLPLQTGCLSHAARKAAFFCDYVLAVMRHDPLYAKAWRVLNHTGGVTIRTTLGPRQQGAADRAVNFIVPARSRIYNPGRNADTEVLLQPGSGAIRAIAMDRSFGTGSAGTTVDYAVNTEYGHGTGVQTGSSSKLFTLVTALKQGRPFGFRLSVKSPTKVGPYRNCHHGRVRRFKVINAEGAQGKHTYTLYNGTTESINAFYATLEKRVGLCNVVRTAASMGMVRADGVSLLRRDPNLPRGRNQAADNIPSFTLGSVYVSPLNMAAAYATVAARGVYCRPYAIRAITDRRGASLPVEKRHCHRVLSRRVADAANYVLRGVLRGGGTAYNRGIGIPAAAKTGTANGGYYAAFAGYTPRLVGYVSVFNPISPTGWGAMLNRRARYREVDGQLATPSQMYGDNAPAATWQMTFESLHLRRARFHRPPRHPYFNVSLKHAPGKSRATVPAATPTPGGTPAP